MKHSSRGGPRSSRTTAAEVNVAIEATRAYWEAGRQSLERFPADGKPRDNPDLKGLDQSSSERQLIQIRRRTASAYDAKSLETFFRLCRSAGYAPTAAVLYELAMVPQDGRPEAQRKVLSEHWTANELESWRKARHAPRRAAGAGRRPKVTDAARAMREICYRWRQIRKVIGDGEGRGGSGLSPDARRWADNVDVVMGRLEQALSPHPQRNVP
jgi:hypothetical protein